MDGNWHSDESNCGSQLPTKYSTSNSQHLPDISFQSHLSNAKKLSTYFKARYQNEIHDIELNQSDVMLHGWEREQNAFNATDFDKVTRVFLILLGKPKCLVKTKI